MMTSSDTLQGPLRAAFRRLESQVPDFERRAGQLEMARLWSETLARGGALAVEAPTGIGKSIAYLIPALLLRARGSGPIVISTCTKALQDQLLTRDVPLAFRAIGGARRVVTLKGRSSYLCRRRASAKLAQRRLFAGPGFEESDRDRLIEWVERTARGEFEELAEEGIEIPFALRLEIVSDPIFCGGTGCDPQSGCFAKLARREARRADLVIVNHALLLSDAGLRATLVVEAGALILDEAHHLERVAREQFGVSIGTQDLARLAGRTDAKTGTLRLLSRTLRRGRGAAVAERITSAEAAIQPVLLHSAALARDLARILPDGSPAARLTRETDLAVVSPAALDQLLASLGHLSRALELAADTAESEGGKALRPEGLEAVEELRARQAAWIEIEQALRAATRLEDRGMAFYLDRDDRGTPRLNRRPLRVGAVLREQLFDRCERTLLTSATLTPESDFEPMLEALGLDAGEVETARLSSPFPLERQVLSAVLDGPDPADPEFVERLAALVLEIAASTRRNLLVLLTSYAMLEQIASRLRGPLAAAGLRLLRQAPGESSGSLAGEFRALEGAVLLGTASFWEGVDFPGASLEVLVIARLPFAVPNDPLVAARSEEIEREGGDAFRDLMLPEAILRFRQGVGRLIRTARDRGVVIVGDPRIARAGYGARFLATLPTRPLAERSPSAIAAAAREWLAGEGSPCPV
jgi:ATP-dependent DNA helicase DinG